MRKPGIWDVSLWVVLFAGGILTGYALRERRAAVDGQVNAVLHGLGRASQAQVVLTMIEQDRGGQLQPMLERQLETDVRIAYQALAVGHAQLPSSMPNLALSLRKAGEYLSRRHASRDLVTQALWVAEYLRAGR